MRKPALATVLGIIVLMGAGTSAAQAATFTARGSVEQVYATDLTPGEQVTLLDGAGATVATRQANELGGALFREVAPGKRYRVRSSDGTTSGALTVLPTSRPRRARASTASQSRRAATAT